MNGKTVLGSGSIVLDTIVVREYPTGPQKVKFIDNVKLEEVGGTCGNVMCMLSHLGMKVYPWAHLDNSPQGYQIKKDLERYGADTRFVRNDEKGGTSLLRCTHKISHTGEHIMKPRKTSPGSMFPKNVQPGALNGEAADFVERLDFTPDVFFFDDQAAGNMIIAQELRKKGTLVYFEPEGMKGSMRAFLSRVNASDIVKFSGEKITDPSFTKDYTDKLFIQTMGSEGLKFSLRGGKWITIPPVKNDNVVDWEGAGDWTSSAFIAYLADHDCLKMDSLTETFVKEALEYASTIASKSVSYLGSKGMIAEKNDLSMKYKE